MEQIVFLHLSDLHCQRQVTHEVLGISMVYAAGLANKLDDVRAVTGLAESEPLRAMVTGDLSDSGFVGELALAHTWLRGYFRLRLAPPLQTAGLGLTDEAVLTIPGNHDHWQGCRWAWCPAFSSAAIAEHFAVTPWHASWTTAGLRLSVFGVDSASGMATVGSTNRFALGGISNDEFLRLEALLHADQTARSEGAVVRCFLCHHSLAYRDRWAGHWNELESGSRTRLEDLGRRFGVSTILTGHTHDFFYPADLRTFPVEFRSSSLMGDAMEAVADMDRRPGFWVHSVRRNGDRPEWWAWRYGWNGTGFTRVAWQPCVRLLL